MTQKKVALGILVILLIAVMAVGLYVSYWGLIPRHDYDLTPPEFPGLNEAATDGAPPTVLIFNKTNGFIHHDAIPAANKALTQIAKSKGFQVFSTMNGAVHNFEQLRQFDLLIWNNVSGDVLTEDQRQAFKGWMKEGGRWLGIHASGGDLEYEWDWYVKEFLGAQFIGHTMHPQFTDASLNKVNLESAITRHLPETWIVPQEEWYAFDQNPADSGFQVLITADETTYNTAPTPWLNFVASMEGTHPLVWMKQVDTGRMLYTSIGHQAATYEIPEYKVLLGSAMDWLMETEK